MSVEVQPLTPPRPLKLLQRGQLKSLTAHALLAQLPEHIAERELQTLQKQLGLDGSRMHTHHIHTAACTGNALILVIESEHCNEVISAIGRRGLPAEIVAQRVVEQAREYLRADVPVGQHLADQLLLPLAVAVGGCYRTLKPDSHTRTNIDVIHAFTGADIRCRQVDEQSWELSVGSDQCRVDSGDS
jgi:RNA 3'-terminal phosphate cyclase (ATP)